MIFLFWVILWRISWVFFGVGLGGIKKRDLRGYTI